MKVPVVPDPVKVAAPGDAVTVQLPEAGNPLKLTDPVGVKQDGCVIVPITGAVGLEGIAFIAALADATEVQPPSFVTVNV